MAKAEKPAPEKKPLGTTYYPRRAEGEQWEVVEVTLFSGGEYTEKVLQKSARLIVRQRLMVLLDRVLP